MIKCNICFPSISVPLILFSELWSLKIYSEVEAETLEAQLNDPQLLELETKLNSSTATSIEPTIERNNRYQWQ